MYGYLVKRVLWSVVVVWGVTFMVFFATHLPGGGDPAALYLPMNVTREQLDEFRRRRGFDQPWYVQYWWWLMGRNEEVRGVIRGDFGVSLRYARPVVSLITDRLPATLQLALAAEVFALAFAVPLGIFAATRRNSILDGLTMVGAMVGQSMPGFWLGLMLIIIFGVRLGRLPISGMGTFKHLILPSVTLGTFFLARTTRLVRSGMLEVLGQDYVRTARAKGLPERLVIWRHALLNSLIPLVTVIGLEFGALLGGTIVVETVFAWPGVGRLIYNAINQRDFPLIQAAVFIIAVIYVAINLVVDVSYTFLDPRVRLEGTALGA